MGIKPLPEELPLSLVIKLPILFLDPVHVTFELGGLLLQFKDGFILVLDQSGQVGDPLLLLLCFTLQLVLLQSIVLQLLTHLNETLALLVAILVLQSVQ